MEPWQQEELRQLRFAADRARLPRCACCDGHIGTERYLALEGFGLQGYACEKCVEGNMGYSEDLMDRR